MKKKLFLLLAMLALVVCMLAISVSAAEPDTSKECVTLDDGTVCPLWDTDGNPLIWYVTSNTDGVKTYAYVAANDASVDYYNGWSGGDQLGKITITASEGTYNASSIAVFNMRGGVVKITSGQRVGNNVTIFVQSLFYGNTNLEYAYLPLDFVKLNSQTFKQCSNLKYINIEEITTLENFGTQEFNGCTSLFEGLDIDLSSTKITSLGNNIFASVPFKSLKVPTTVTSIGSDAFKNCTSLEAVYGTSAYYGSGNVTSISQLTFSKCQKLTHVDGLIENGILTIPESITSIGNYAFDECKSLQAVTGMQGVTSIGNNAFYNSAIESISLEDSIVTSIGSNAFRGCSSLESLTMPNTVTSIGNNAFQDCGIQSIKFSTNANFTTISAYAFLNCNNLTRVDIPDNITSLKNYAFAECDNLGAVYLSKNLVELEESGNGVFENCKKAYFVDSFGSEEKPSVYYFPKGLTGTFNGETFKTWNAMNDTVVLPVGVTGVKDAWAFGAIGGNKNVVFLGNITTFVFAHDSDNINFYFANAENTTANIGFSNTRSNPSNCTAYVCAEGKYGKLDTYKDNQDVWSDMTAAEHLPGVVETTEVTCTEDGVTKYSCFCGFCINTVINEEATGHNENSPVVDIYYPTFIVMGYAVCECSDCSETFTATEATYAPIFVSKGYSCTVYDGMISIVQGFDVNREALAEYTAIDGNTISYGVVATSVNKVADGNIDVVNNVDGVTAIDFTTADKAEFTRFEIKVADIAEANWDTGLYACAYVIADGAVSFISENASTATATAKTAATILQENPV